MLLQSKTSRMICVMFHSYVILVTLLRARSRSQRKKVSVARFQKEKGGRVYGARQGTVIATCCNNDIFPCLPCLRSLAQRQINCFDTWNYNKFCITFMTAINELNIIRLQSSYYIIYKLTKCKLKTKRVFNWFHIIIKRDATRFWLLNYR